ncbi:MAG: NUDIX domain-containing protein [Novosphingobium sp.]|nr:NUDIX domain-containing protein [Novosphingobium sp.]
MRSDEEYAETDEAPPATPAATIVIFRNDPAGGAPQLLMVERSASMSFAGGAAVFPGGRVDDADRQLAATLVPESADEETFADCAARVAAVRETIEETGLFVGIDRAVSHDEALAARDFLCAQGALAPVLERHGWRLDLASLTYFARWRPKHRHMRVYDTRFFIADLGTGAVDLLVDATENTHLFWASAAEALRLAHAGKIKIIFPTRRNLERLAGFASFAQARAQAEAIPARMVTPFVEQRDGRPWLCIPADAGYPVAAEILESAARG